MQSWIGRVAAALAVMGGCVLLAMALVTVIAVITRAVPMLPTVSGDFELVEMGAAVSVFLFLPWCQFSRGQVTVDILSQRLGARAHAALGCLGNGALTLLAVVILWRFWLGFGEKFPFGSERLRGVFHLGDRPYFTETSYDLLIPVWIPFALCLPGAGWLVVTCAWTTWQSFRWLRAGTEP